jgi:hypothetical protein
MPLVTRLRFAFRHAVHHVVPDLVRLKFPGLDAGNGLNISRETLLHPMLIVRQGGESHVHQFMSHDPVVG